MIVGAAMKSRGLQPLQPRSSALAKFALAFAAAALIVYALIFNRQPDPVSPDVVLAQFPPDFIFGVATAPAHVEDHLNDTWLDWADSGHIPRWSESPRPADRLEFWTHPEVDIDLAQSTGVKLFRMGVDWGRLVPHMPGTKNCDTDGLATFNASMPCRNGIQDRRALERYREIMRMVRTRGMQISLTLFHHSLPRWASTKAFQGWVNLETVQHFMAFVSDLIPHVSPLVDHYVTFNEPAVFGNLVYGLNLWPGRLSDQPELWRAYWNLPFLRGTVIAAYTHMAEAHALAYKLIKSTDLQRAYPQSPDAAMVGIAHNVAWYQGEALAAPVATFMDFLMNLEFMYRISHNIDYIGLNYYGTELITLTGVAIDGGHEYSESGRAVSPDGLFNVLTDMHTRFNVEKNRNLPIYILENGISDETDILRPSYMIEHLLAVQKAIDHGIPVKAFTFWTISDNWEWADGYCPKFGMFSVDRSLPGFPRTARPSVQVVQKLTASRTIRQGDRMSAFNLVRRNLRVNRPFCRSSDGQSTPDKAIYRDIKWHNWMVDYKLELVPARPWWEWLFPRGV